MIPYGFIQIALWFQLFIWFNLFHSKIKLSRIVETGFYLAGFMAMLLVKLYGIQVGFFTTFILIQYIGYVMGATAIFRGRFSFTKAVSLGFLIVFFNSFYWEVFYHIYEIQVGYPVSLTFNWWYVRLPQWIRILPAFFLAKNFDIKTRWPLMVGLVFTFVLSYLRFVYSWLPVWLHPVQRGVCLIVLIYTIYISRSKGDVVHET